MAYIESGNVADFAVNVVRGEQCTMIGIVRVANLTACVRQHELLFNGITATP